ncbi:MAG: hypothetical protein KAW46_00825 [candidate division Zixibacteria bacterium]|nr:hypothetical protein [candidate division Zixibacteria bacterium]
MIWDRINMLTAGSAIVILILFAAGLLFDVPQLWGVNLGRFISSGATLAVFVLVALLMWDTISRPIMARLDRFSGLLANHNLALAYHQVGRPGPAVEFLSRASRLADIESRRRMVRRSAQLIDVR